MIGKSYVCLQNDVFLKKTMQDKGVYENSN